MPRHWVLLRGLSREAAHWGDFIDRCQQRFPAFYFECIDLPGCGEFCSLSSPATIDSICQHVQQQAQKKMGQQPFGVIALSMGAMVALQWLALQPNQIQALVAINTSSNQSPYYHRIKPTALLSLLPNLIMSTSIRERKMLSLVSNSYGSNDAIIKQWLHIQQQRPCRYSTYWRQLLAAARFSLPPTLTKNGLVLHSQQDRLVDFRCSALIANKYQWPIALHPNAGHDLPLDDPDWVINKIDCWLNELHQSV